MLCISTTEKQSSNNMAMGPFLFKFKNIEP
jgi:hypothetical protein